MFVMHAALLSSVDYAYCNIKCWREKIFKLPQYYKCKMNYMQQQLVTHAFRESW